jgi:hypothetical protein
MVDDFSGFARQAPDLLHNESREFRDSIVLP